MRTLGKLAGSLVLLGGVILLLASDVMVGQPTHIGWTKEPDSILGVPWTITEQQLVSSLKNGACRTPLAALGDRICTGDPVQIGEAQVNPSFVFWRGKLLNVFLSFEEKDFRELRAVFAEKYGDPTERTIETLHTRMNVEYQGERAVWRGNTITLHLTQYDGAVDESVATVTVTSVNKDFQAEKEERRKKAADAL